MASLRTRKTSRYYWACFTDATGKRIQRTTGILNTGKAREGNEAMRIAGEYEEAARKLRDARKVRKVIEDLHKRISGMELPSITLRGYVTRWLGAKEHGTAASTQGFYQGSTAKFLEFLGPEADANLQDITREHLDRFRSQQAGERKLAPKTVNHDLKCLKMLFKSARRDGFITEDISEHVSLVKESRATDGRSVFTMDQLRAVLAQADEEWRSMIFLGMYTGQRLGDLANLRWSQVDLERQEIRLTTAKTGKRLIIPMARPLADHLMKAPSSDDPAASLHPRAAAVTERSGKTSTLSNQFTALLAAAGLRERKAHRATHGNGRGVGRDRSGLSFHSLRHTANSLLKEAGIPDAVIQALIGHDDRDISDHYTHIGREALSRAAAAFPPL